MIYIPNLVRGGIVTGPPPGSNLIIPTQATLEDIMLSPMTGAAATDAFTGFKALPLMKNFDDILSRDDRMNQYWSFKTKWDEIPPKATRSTLPRVAKIAKGLAQLK